jgi:Tfp pilus assembly protein PilO
MSAKLSNTKVLAGVVFGAVALVTAVAWILVVGPQRSKVGKLDGEITSVQTQIDQRKAALATPKVNLHVRVSDLYRLTRAMPDAADMPGIILVLSRLASGHTLKFVSIQPGSPVAQTGFNVQPLSVVVEGGFGDVSSFLGDLRKLVRVKKHELAATGRLFAIDAVDFATPEAPKTFPTVKATLTVDAFTFAGGVTTPNPSTSTPSAANGTVAAGANP